LRRTDLFAVNGQTPHAPIVRERFGRFQRRRSMRLLLPLAAFVLLVSAAHAMLPGPPKEVAVVATGRAPCGLAAFGGELWVGVYEAGTVLRLDRAGRIQRRHRVGRFACQLAVDKRWAWVTRDNADEVVRIDPRSGRLTKLSVSSPLDIALAAGSAWVTSFETGTVTRIDAETGRVTRSWRVGGYPTGITVCGGRVWVGHGRSSTWLTSIDPGTGRMRRVDVGVSTPRMPRCIEDELWVTTEDAVFRASPQTGEVRAQILLAGTPAEAGLARSASGGVPVVWVTNKERSLVYRIDPGSGRVVDSFPAGSGALAQEVFAGSVWITSFAGSDVRRYDP
jgi:streptogramin lyase